MSSVDWPEIVTPRDIAARLGITTQRPDKTVRAELRRHPPVPHARYGRWELTPEQADEFVRGWASRRA